MYIRTNWQFPYLMYSNTVVIAVGIDWHVIYFLINFVLCLCYACMLVGF